MNLRLNGWKKDIGLAKTCTLLQGKLMVADT